jgi:hypothetical protein
MGDRKAILFVFETEWALGTHWVPITPRDRVAAHLWFRCDVAFVRRRVAKS